MDRGEAAPERAPLPWRHALALPVWWVTLLLLYLANTRTPWDTTSTDLLVLVILKRGWSPEIAIGLAVCALFVVLGGGVLAVAGLGRRSRADPHDVAGEAFHWGLRAPGRRWWALLAFWPLMAVAEGFDIEWLKLVIVLAAVPIAVAAPFLSGQRAPLQGSADAWRPHWDWPGWPVLGTVFALAVADHVAEFALAAGTDSDTGLSDGLRYALMLAGGIGVAWISTWLAATRAGVWLDRAASGRSLRAVARTAARWRLIGPGLALEARCLWWGLMFAAPLLLATVFLIYDAHSLQQVHGDAFPDWLVTWLQAWTTWWWVLIAPLSLPACLMTRRLWVSLVPGPPS